VRYGVFGLGDRTYAETFNFGGKRFDDILAELGATRIGERHKHDASSGVLPEETALEWCQQWLAQFQQGTEPRFNLSNGGAHSQGVGGFILLLVVALVLFIAFGLNTLRGPITRAVTNATGRELRIEGDLKPLWSWRTRAFAPRK